MIWNGTKEYTNRGGMTNLQNARLAKLMDKVYHSVEYYRKKMQVVGLESGDTKGIEDLGKLSSATEDGLRDIYPFGMFVVPDSQITRIHTFSDTTGKATVVGYTRKDIDVWGGCVVRCITMAGLGRDDTIRVAHGYDLFTGDLEAHYGAEGMGTTVVPMSTGNTRELVTMMMDFEVIGVVYIPSYLLHMAETIGKVGVKDRIKLKAPINGTEPWTDKMRTQIERQLGIHAHGIYGLSEIMGPDVATDCQYHTRLHIREDHLLPKIIDQYTLEPLRDGMEDELVIPTLTKEGLPLIRYRTKDPTSLEHGPRGYGRTTARTARFIGKTDNMLIIYGVNIFPSQIESTLLEMRGTTPHYLLTVDRISNLDTLEVQAEVEERSFSDEIRGSESLTGKIAHVVQEATSLTVKMRLMESRSIEHNMSKTKHVIDKRALI